MKISPFTPLFWRNGRTSDGIESRYTQTFATTDKILIEYIMRTEEAVPVVKLDDVEVGTHTHIISDTWLMRWVELSGLAEGEHIVSINEMESYPFIVTADAAVLAKTTLIQYSMRDNRQRTDGIFLMGDERKFFALRVPGGFKDGDMQFAVDNEQFQTQEGDPVTLYSLDSVQQKFTMGSQIGVPARFAERLNLILTCHYVYLDGLRYERKEGSTPEQNVMIEGLDSFVYKVLLQRVNNLAAIIEQAYDGTAEPTPSEWPNPGGDSGTGNVHHADRADWAYEAEHAENASHAQTADNADNADHAQTADNADKWDGEHFMDWLDQPVKRDSDVTFRNLIIQQIITASGGKITELEVKNLSVTGLMEVFRLLVRQMNATSGDLVNTAAASEIERVEVVDGGYKCFFRNDDGSRKTRNTWIVGDQALCHTDNLDAPGQYEGVTNKHYWRLVTEVGADFIVLSADIHEAYDGDYNAHAGHIPALKDEIVQFGYQPQPSDFPADGGEQERNKNRTTVQWIGSDENGSFFGMWDAVVDFTMPGKPYITVNGQQTQDPRITFFHNQDHHIVNSRGYKLYHNGVAYPSVLYQGDWQSGHSTGKMYEQWTFDGCLLQVTAAQTTEDPIILVDGAYKVSADWRLVSGTPTLGRRTMRFVSEYGEHDTWITYGDRVTFRAVIEDAAGNDRSGEYEGWTIRRQNGDTAEDVASDSVWNATRAAISGDGVFIIEWNAAHDDLQADRATFVVEAWLKGSSGASVRGTLSI